MPAVLAGALIAFLQAMTLFGSPAIWHTGGLPHHDHKVEPVPVSAEAELAAAASLPLLVLTIALLRARISFSGGAAIR